MIKNPFTWLKRFGSLLGRVFAIVEKVVPEETLRWALLWVKVAAEKYTDNAQRREFVVDILRKRGIPESIARLAVELAVRLFKDELAKLEVR